MNDLDKLRHSTAHLLAAAVLELYPDAKPTIGPPIDTGFYYDFDDLKISDADLPKIEAKMQELVKSWDKFEIVEGKPANKYKQELLDALTEKPTYYKSGNFVDLCAGPHVDDAKKIKFFKLLKLAGAYWHGDEKNKMLTRIYGTAFFTQKELDDYLTLLGDAENHDHRKIGKDLNLFVFSDLVGKGLPLFTPKGTTIRRELERFVVDEEIKRGYLHVITPPLAKVDLYKTSGHYPYYKDTMYPLMKVDDEELILRPMTCPHHFMLYKSQQHSYKELPIRYAELSPQFRYEKSGELTGLMRVRMFCLADAHIFVQKESALIIINEVLDLIDYANSVFGLKKGEDYRYRLSLGDRRDDKKYYKDDASWEFAENVLRTVLKDRQAPFFEAEGEAAFYGPKIDVQLKNAHGKEETAFTVQYDFVMPKRFELRYIDEKGQEVEPVVIHRSSIGAIERLMGFLIEKYGGAFPTWLAPVQVAVLPIADRHNEYATEVASKLKENNIRVEIDTRADTLGAKIRDHQMQKVPYMIILGDKEIEAKKVAVRKRDGKDLGQLDLNKFIEDVKIEISNKSLD